jgi:hypothetical protein
MKAQATESQTHKQLSIPNFPYLTALKENAIKAQTGVKTQKIII